LDLRPATDVAVDIGSSSKRVRQLHAQDVACSNLTLAGTFSANAATVSSLTLADAYSSNFQLAFTLSNVGALKRPASILPDYDIIMHNSITPRVDLAYDIGAYRRRFSSCYIANVNTGGLYAEQGNVLSVGTYNSNAAAATASWELASNAANASLLDLRPATDVAVDIGSSSKRVRQLYARDVACSNLSLAGTFSANAATVSRLTLADASNSILAFTLSNIAAASLPASQVTNYDIIAHNTITPGASNVYNLGQAYLYYHTCFCETYIGSSLRTLRTNDIRLGVLVGNLDVYVDSWAFVSQGSNNLLNLLPMTDNTLDIGSTTYRVRQLHAMTANVANAPSQLTHVTNKSYVDKTISKRWMFTPIGSITWMGTGNNPFINRTGTDPFTGPAFTTVNGNRVLRLPSTEKFGFSTLLVDIVNNANAWPKNMVGCEIDYSVRTGTATGPVIYSGTFDENSQDLAVTVGTTYFMTCTIFPWNYKGRGEFVANSTTTFSLGTA
jgi:hypothetical protein